MEPEDTVIVTEKERNIAYAYGVGVGLLIVSIGYWALFLASWAQEPKIESEPAIAVRYFTDFETWNPDLLIDSSGPPTLIEDAPNLVGYVEFGKNNIDYDIKNRLLDLHSLKALRSEQMKEEARRLVTNIRNMRVREDSTLVSVAFLGNTPATADLITRVINEMEVHTIANQRLFNTARPVHYDSTIEPMIESPKTPSFPSSIASQATLIALVLADIDPKNATEYLSYARRTASIPEIVGINFVSDTQAGVALAERMHRVLITNTTYQKLLREARKEFPQS